MSSTRTATAIVGLTASLLISAAAWFLFETALLFIFVPFVPWLLGRRSGQAAAEPSPRECPLCGFRTAEPGFDYCPRDGTRLSP